MDKMHAEAKAAIAAASPAQGAAGGETGGKCPFGFGQTEAAAVPPPATAA